MGPHGRTHPFPFFDYVGLGLFDEFADAAQRLAAPTAEAGDSFVDQFGCGTAFVRMIFLHLGLLAVREVRRLFEDPGWRPRGVPGRAFLGILGALGSLFAPDWRGPLSFYGDT
jgi:hypothetical protein